MGEDGRGLVGAVGSEGREGRASCLGFELSDEVMIQGGRRGETQLLGTALGSADKWVWAGV